jgi:hypothetical protein
MKMAIQIVRLWIALLTMKRRGDNHKEGEDRGGAQKVSYEIQK